MNRFLFQDLYKFITADIPKGKISEDEFFFYLIGYYSKTPSKAIDYNIFFADDTSEYTHGRKKLRSTLGHGYPKMLEINKELRLRDLFWRFLSSSPQDARKALDNIPARLNEIQGLYQKHKIPMPAVKNAEALLLYLFTVCVTENPERLFASYKAKLPKPSTLESILERAEDAKRFKDAINTYHKVIISGQYGSGKSLFVQYCLSQWETQDYCYLSYEIDLKTTLKTIDYHDDIKACYEDATNRLTEKTSSSPLLIIDKYPSKNISEDLDELSNYPIDIIVITTVNIINGHFHPFTLTKLSDEALKKIFERHSGLTLEDPVIFEKILCLTIRNPLMVSLFAYQCNKSAQSSQECGCQHDIIDKALSSLEVLEKQVKSDIKFKHPYNKETLELTRHVKYIYKKLSSNMEKYLRDTMEYLCCFGWSPLPLKFISEILPSYKEEYLSTLSEMGLLTLTEDTVQLTSLLSHAVFASENPYVRNYDMMVERLIRFLLEYDQTLSMPYLSNALFMFTKFLYEKVYKTNNGERQQKTAKSFEKWQDLLYLTIIYYMNCGEFSLANQLAAEIQYAEHNINAHNPLDQLSFLLTADMWRLNNDEIFKKIDELYLILSVMPTSLSNADFSFLFTTAMDHAIYFYCKTLPDADPAKQCCYINIISTILDYISRKSRNIKISISEEGLSYYELCLKLMTVSYLPDLEPNTIKEDRPQVIERKNIDFQIRKIAFLLCIQNQNLFLISSNQEELDPNDLTPLSMFKTYQMPVLSYLNEQIRQCKLIPYFTLHLCFLAYVSTLELQYTVLDNNSSAVPPLPLEKQSDSIKELLHRCALSKKEKDDIIRTWDESISHL